MSAVLAAARERAVILDAGGEQLFAIVTEPGGASTASRRGIVFLTRPRSHRNRMWVDAARQMAERGYTGIRIDYHGEGDSTGESRTLEIERPYADDALAAVRYLADECGVERIGLVGSCFDARTALAAVHDAPRYDALVFLSAPVLDERSEMERLVSARDLGHYLRRIREPGAWRALLSLERIGIALRIISTRLRRRFAPAEHPAESSDNGRRNAGRSTPAAAAAAANPSPGFLRDFGALVARGTPALFLYGDQDDQYPGFRLVMDRELPRLSPDERKRIEIAVLPGEAHGYLSIAIQRSIVERSLEWLDRTLSEGSA